MQIHTQCRALFVTTKEPSPNVSTPLSLNPTTLAARCHRAVSRRVSRGSCRGLERAIESGRVFGVMCDERGSSSSSCTAGWDNGAARR